MKTYHGKRNLGVATEPGPVTVSTDGGNAVALNPRTDLVRHSEVLNWGYYASGPAQLAVALLADALGIDALALDLCPFFKEAIVAKCGSPITM
jgi:hypothetical protein